MHTTEPGNTRFPRLAKHVHAPKKKSSGAAKRNWLQPLNHQNANHNTNRSVNTVMSSYVQPLFGIPLYRNTRPELEGLTERVSNLEYERMAVGNGDISTTKWLLEQESFQDLRSLIMEEMNIFTHYLLHMDPQKIQWRLQNSWAVRHNKGDWSQAHHHTNSVFSGVYYVRTNENSGNIVFTRTHDTVSTTTFDFPYTNFNELNSKSFGITPQTGEIVMFPSHLMHSVDPNNSDQIRYAVAFNFVPTGTWGEGEHEISL